MIDILTFNDLVEIGENERDRMEFVLDAIREHKGSELYKTAYDAGLDFVGFEIDKDYFDKQEQRFQNHIAQTSLFVGLKDDIEKEKLEVSCHSEDWIN